MRLPKPAQMFTVVPPPPPSSFVIKTATLFLLPQKLLMADLDCVAQVLLLV